MIIVLAALIFGIVLLFIVYSRITEKEIRKPVKNAWSDGFEAIVVVDGIAKSQHMTEAIESIRCGGSALLSEENHEAIIKSIISDRKKLHNYTDTTSYPFVDLNITNLENERQKIIYSVHYSLRTYEYSYYAGKDEIIPLTYYEHDLKGKITNIYE